MAKLVLVNLDMNQNQLLQAVMQAGDAPANPTAGQFYYDSTKSMRMYIMVLRGN